jgi:hypothetical protein
MSLIKQVKITSILKLKTLLEANPKTLGQGGITRGDKNILNDYSLKLLNLGCNLPYIVLYKM